jgi:hypothetical protein
MTPEKETEAEILAYINRDEGPPGPERYSIAELEASCLGDIPAEAYMTPDQFDQQNAEYNEGLFQDALERAVNYEALDPRFSDEREREECWAEVRRVGGFEPGLDPRFKEAADAVRRRLMHG